MLRSMYCGGQLQLQRRNPNDSRYVYDDVDMYLGVLQVWLAVRGMRSVHDRAVFEWVWRYKQWAVHHMFEQAVQCRVHQ